MPSPPPGASKTIFVTPRAQTPLPNLSTYPKPDLSRSLTQTRTGVQTNINAPWNGGRERYQQQVKEIQSQKIELQRQAQQKIQNARRGIQTPQTPSGSGGNSISGTGGGERATSNGTARTPSSSGATPPAAGAAAGFSFSPLARFFWKGVGSGIGWEASRQFQGRASEIASEQKEQEAIRSAEQQRQQQYLSNPPATEVIEKEKVPFKGGQMSGVMYRVIVLVKYLDSFGYQQESTYGVTTRGKIYGVNFVIISSSIVETGSMKGKRYVNVHIYVNTEPNPNIFIGGSGWIEGSETVNITIVRVDGLPDTGGNPPPTQQGSNSQYNGTAPGAIALSPERAPPPAIPKPQPQLSERPSGGSLGDRKSETVPPPLLYAPGVRGNLGGERAPSPPAPEALGGQTIVTGTSQSEKPSDLPEGVGTKRGFVPLTEEERMVASWFPQPFPIELESDVRERESKQTQTQTAPEVATIPFPPPLLFTPAAPNGNVTDVEFPNGEPKVTQQEEKKVTQAAPPTSCEISNACVINKLGDAQRQNNNNYSGVTAALQGIDLSALAVINDKLGPQLPGGISGYFKAAWEATKMDKVLNMINTLLLVHNAAMLSRNLGETLGDAASAVLQFLGIKDHEKNTIDVNEVLGKSITDLIKSILGEEVYTGVSKQWNLYNRIITAGMGVVAAIQNMVNAALDGLNTIGSWIAKMGNRAQEQGMVDDRSWKWMDETPNFRNPTARFLEKVENLEDAADSVYMLVSSGIEVQQAYTEATQATTTLLDTLKKFDEDKVFAEREEVRKNTSPFPQKIDVVKHESEEQ